MSAVRKAITREELSRHCHRRTRGAELTLEQIERLLLELSSPLATDSSGEPVLSNKMVTIWEEKKKHVKCIQDPDGIILYTITGHISKDGVELPVFRCAHGTTSLESFHLHLAGYVNVETNVALLFRFIPGLSASDVHYQGFLLEGLSRWNQAPALAAAQYQDCQLSRCRTRPTNYSLY